MAKRPKLKTALANAIRSDLRAKASPIAAAAPKSRQHGATIARAKGAPDRKKEVLGRASAAKPADRKKAKVAAAEPAVSASKKSSRAKPNLVPVHVWASSQHSGSLVTPIPFLPTSKVLLVGEGDFSFAKALAQALGPKSRLVATCLDDRDAIGKKYATAHANIADLERLGATVMYSVDATRLHTTHYKGIAKAFGSNVAPTRVVFNFPHTGAGIKDRAHNIRAQQKLLLAFFQSVAAMMEMFAHVGGPLPGSNPILVLKNNPSMAVRRYRTMMMSEARALDPEKLSQTKWAKGKRPASPADASGDSSSGEEENGVYNFKDAKCTVEYYDAEDDVDDDDSFTGEKSEGAAKAARVGREEPEIHITLRQGDPYDEWNGKKLALSTGKLMCKESFRFVPSKYPGYKHCRTSGDVACKSAAASADPEHPDNGDGDDDNYDDDGKDFTNRPSKTLVFTLSSGKKDKAA